MATVDLELVSGLYRKHADDLAGVIEAQRRFLTDTPAVTPQLDDLEAEITYLLLREFRPASVVEIGTFHGWSTTWILSALRDNGHGHLHSFDRIDNVVQNVPGALSEGRWTFRKGDVRDQLAAVPADTGYLFVDADHGGRFAKWYLANLFPAVAAGTPVSVHDVFHRRRPLPLTEGAVVTRWLDEGRVRYFTPSARRAPDAFRALCALKGELGLGPVRGTTANPMLYFTMPG